MLARSFPQISPRLPRLPRPASPPTRPRSNAARVGGRALPLVLAVVLLLTGALASPLYAQPGLDESALEPGAGPVAGASRADGQTPPSEAAASPRTMLDTVKDGGIVGLLIILLSVVAVGFMVEHAMSIRKSTLMPEQIMNDLDQMIEHGQVEQAIQYCRDPNHLSLASDVVLAGLERFRSSEFGFAEYKAAVEEAGEDHTGRLYRKTEVLGLIGSITPMLGLTGTVLGMIRTFNSIASAEGAARPDQLAGGISQALVTTLLGLIVAIPAMVAFSYFRNRIDSIVAEVGKRVEQIMMPLGRRRG